MITHAKPKGVRLISNNGINFPDSDLNWSPLTAKDLADLDFVAANANIIGFSHVEDINDINYLLGELKKRDVHNKAIIAKIETNQAVKTYLKSF